jgi:hypothetical protein
MYLFATVCTDGLCLVRPFPATRIPTHCPGVKEPECEAIILPPSHKDFAKDGVTSCASLDYPYTLPPSKAKVASGCA